MVLLFVQGSCKFLRSICKSDMVLRNPLLIMHPVFAPIEIIDAQIHELFRPFGLKIEAENAVGEDGEEENRQSKGKNSGSTHEGKIGEEKPYLYTDDEKNKNIKDHLEPHQTVQRIYCRRPKLCDLLMVVEFIERDAGSRGHNG